jgi:uncharacterized protein YkwD
MRRSQHHLVTGAIGMGLVLSVAAPTSANSACFKFSRTERKLARMTNAARHRHGLTRLNLDPQLSKVGGRHARDMARRRLLYHTPSNVLGWRVTHWRILGENVGVGAGVASIQRAFLRSPEHRSIMLSSSYRYVGVGVHQRGSNRWVTVLFEYRRNPGTRLSMPSC